MLLLRGRGQKKSNKVCGIKQGLWDDLKSNIQDGPDGMLLLRGRGQKKSNKVCGLGAGAKKQGFDFRIPITTKFSELQFVVLISV